MMEESVRKCGLTLIVTVLLLDGCEGYEPSGTSIALLCSSPDECGPGVPFGIDAGAARDWRICMFGECSTVGACDPTTGRPATEGLSQYANCVLEGLPVFSGSETSGVAPGYVVPFRSCTVDEYAVFVGGKYSLENYGVDVPILAPSPSEPGERYYCREVRERIFVSTGADFAGAPPAGTRYSRCSGFMGYRERPANEEVPCTPGAITILEEPATPTAGR
jgi:hypothetical protein